MPALGIKPTSSAPQKEANLFKGSLCISMEAKIPEILEYFEKFKDFKD